MENSRKFVHGWQGSSAQSGLATNRKFSDPRKTYGPDVQQNTEFFYLALLVWTLCPSPRAVKEIPDA
jgi:hypothetical protein